MVLKIGVVGFGKMGRIRKATLDARSDARVVALADPYADMSDQPGMIRHTDWEKLLEEDIDAVVISCTNELIPTVAVAALAKGLHVFCEKPPGRNPQDVYRIREAAQQHPELMVKFGFNHRYHESVEQARRLVSSQSLGKILWMRGVYGKAGGPEFDKNWRNVPSRSGGGILLDQGIHMIDLFHDFCGTFSEVKSFVTSQYWNIPVEDNAFALLRNDQGQVGVIHSSATQWRHTFRLEIFLEKGFLTLEGILSSTMSYGKETLIVARNTMDENGYPLPNPEEVISFFADDRSWEKEMTEFVTCALAGEPVRIGTVQQAVDAMETVFAIYGADNSWTQSDESEQSA
ncbi:Gfo/Idh/MocA family protein [Maricaulis sp.]|uniref:Gfo/Idh/MocA family protein n=1 Tax=Maricaulis sp. TaxID=1486257 RepID=UPI003A929C91